MVAAADILSVVRNLTRDFGTPFEINFPNPVGSQLRLPHPLVDTSSVVVTDNSDSSLVPATAWAAHSHQGVLRLADAASFTSGVTVTGLYYQWFLDEDLLFFIDLMIKEHMHHRPVSAGGVTSIFGAEIEVVGIGALCLSLQSLLVELSTDVNVVSPEGVNIPASQRYNQVQQLLSYWQAKYDEKAAMLNVGLKRIEAFDLRRVSRTTERLVPLYRARELDYHAPPIRVRPPVDPIELTPFDEDAEEWSEAYGDPGLSSGEDFSYGPGGSW